MTSTEHFSNVPISEDQIVFSLGFLRFQSFSLQFFQTYGLGGVPRLQPGEQSQENWFSVSCTYINFMVVVQIAFT